MSRETEWIHKLMYMGRYIRVWAKADEGFPRKEQVEQRDELLELLEKADGADPLEQIAAIPWVQGVEFLDAAGSGRIIYPEWP